MPDKIVTIDVDGRTLEAKAGQMLIEVTDANDIYIPRFCYHDKLSVAANCRMCLVEVEKSPKPLPACATPVMDGMKVLTHSNKAIDAQKGVMEFLLINHPLDCPICDQGGECELQDLAMGYGRDVSRFQENKRVVKDKNIGPLVQTDLTRCIHCTRCIRFGEEIAGLRELGATGRGEHMTIGTYIEKSMVSEMSGNVIDICPVGALTSKPFRYSARAWEMVQREGVAVHDSVGSNIHFHLKGNQVMRVVPAENESINEVWLSDRDRFSYEGLYSEDRLTAPMVKQQGEWKEIDWETALDMVKEGLGRVLASKGPEQIGALASPTATLEELYLFQKLFREMGCNNIDHRIHQKDFKNQTSAPAFPWLGQSIADLENLQAVLLVGSNVRKEQPLINHRLRKATLRGGKLSVLNSIDYDFNFDVTNRIIKAPDEIPMQLGGILAGVTRIKDVELDDQVKKLLTGIEVNENHINIARQLLDAENAAVLLGNSAMAHTDFSLLEVLSSHLASHTGARFGYISESGNSAGASLAGVLPHRKPAAMASEKIGLDAGGMFECELAAYVLMGLEPEIDCWNGHQALKSLKAAEFVVSLSAFRTKIMDSYADVLLPVAVYAENSGTYINCEGKAQGFGAVVKPAGEARPAWKIFRVLGNLFELDGFGYNSFDEVKNEIMQLIENIQPGNQLNVRVIESFPEPVGNTLQRITDVPMNSLDPLVRRATALQKTPDCASNKIHINPGLAAKLGVKEGESVQVAQEANRLNLEVKIDQRIADNCVLIHAAQPIHTELGHWQGTINITRA